EVPAAVSVITREDIRAYGWRTLTQALTSLPGIHNTYDRQYDYLGTRGFGLPGDFNTRLLLAINGNRINDIVYDSAGLGRNLPVDLDMIERIEFIPGPGGAVYGQNAMFGVINVITRTGLQVDGWEATASWQQPQRMRETRVRWGRRLDNGFDLLFALSSMRAGGDDLPMTFPGAAADGSDLTGIARGLDGEEDDDLAMHVGRGPWSLDVQSSLRTKDDPTSAYFADPLVPGQYESDDYLLSHFQYQSNVGTSWNVLGRLFTGRQRYNAEYYFEGTGNFSAGISQWHGGELRVLNTAFTGHKLMLGVEVQDNTRIDQSADDYSRGATPVRALFPGPASGDLLIRRDGYRTGLYVQDEWQMSASVSSTLGLRIDRNDTTGTRMSPRAALIWRATPILTLKTIYGRANRAPNSYERDYDDGISLVANPDLTRESIETTELVAESQVARAVGLRVSIYRWEMHDLIGLGIDPVSGVPQYRAARRAVEAQGVEVSTNAAWNFGGRMRASASWQ
ncbi:MAG: TonB-dependent receptor plug domain-containing protein, partial [Burkholderiales bacterium]